MKQDERPGSNARPFVTTWKEGMHMYISLYDLGLFIIFMVLMIVSGYLIAVLHRFFGILGSVREVFDGHAEDLRNIITGLLTALETANELATSLKETAEQTNSAFGSLQSNFTDTVDDFRDGVEMVMLYAKIIGDVCRAVFSKSA